MFKAFFIKRLALNIISIYILDHLWNHGLHILCPFLFTNEAQGWHLSASFHVSLSHTHTILLVFSPFPDSHTWSLKKEANWSPNNFFVRCRSSKLLVASSKEVRTMARLKYCKMKKKSTSGKKKWDFFREGFGIVAMQNSKAHAICNTFTRNWNIRY